ncbi:hypothetical protein C8E97_6022 [Saccharothrix australiensis]|uniref:Uncharacterized protein n=1 Tax=Saccharothrix australiensis TaxID=2072 RepID=A0A495W7P5_9PSEU|nr:hypothetical protein C8E97_6022 [Saccharothrix australiensis]
MDVELVPAASALLLIISTAVFVLACRLSAGEPRRAADARRVARARRAVPWVLWASAAVIAVNLLLVSW